MKHETQTRKGKTMTARQMIPASEAEQHEAITTIGKRGSVGYGHLVDGEAFQSLGNGFYGLVCNSPGGLATYHRDGGKKYMGILNSLMLPPAYKS